MWVLADEHNGESPIPTTWSSDVKHRIAIALAASATTALALSACSASSSTAPSGSATGSTRASATTGGPAASTSATSAPPSSSPVASGSPADIAFAQLMIPHHEQAVEMADMALAPQADASPQVKALATQIKEAQAPEIAQMQGWLQQWGAPQQMASASTDAAGGMAGMDMGGVTENGMMTAQQMAALGKATGPAFDQEWLQLMIAHHEGAITMAEQVKNDSQNAQVVALADAIIQSQTAEIIAMKKDLSQ